MPFKPHGRDMRENIEKELARGCAHFLIAEEKGRPVGTILVTHDGRKGWINRLAVIPAYRNRGIARMLVEKGEKILDDAGIGIIACLIEDYNRESLAVFQKLGYIDFKGMHYLTKRQHPEV